MNTQCMHAFTNTHTHPLHTHTHTHTHRPPTTWRVTLDTRSSTHSLVSPSPSLHTRPHHTDPSPQDVSVSTFAMVDTTPLTGVRTDLMERRLCLTLQPLWEHSGTTIYSLRYPSNQTPSVWPRPLSEPMWPIEARNAAIANTYFVGANNRVGTVSEECMHCMSTSSGNTSLI